MPQTTSSAFADLFSMPKPWERVPVHLVFHPMAVGYFSPWPTTGSSISGIEAQISSSFLFRIQTMQKNSSNSIHRKATVITPGHRMADGFSSLRAAWMATTHASIFPTSTLRAMPTILFCFLSEVLSFTTSSSAVTTLQNG